MRVCTYCLVFPFLIITFLISSTLGSLPVLDSATPATSIVKPGSDTTVDMSKPTAHDDDKESLLVVFSDVDGTLVHYPESTDTLEEESEDYPLLKLPPSSTGMRGIISHSTLQRCQEIRKSGTKLVLVSGMRTSTLIKRLPFLPKADAYCSEAGGRIFYPTKSDATGGTITIQPQTFVGASSEALKPFGLREDADWRQGMLADKSVESNAYEGNQLPMFDGDEVDVAERSGLLWSFADDLIKFGYVLDTKGYSTCFRVNKKQQTDSSIFVGLLEGKIEVPKGLSSSTNLGCVDFYPVKSGKKNCCLYLAGVFGTGKPSSLKERCVCLCDDDNDIEMANACAHAYLPEVTSVSMAEALENGPSQFTKASSANVHGTKATDRALSMVLERPDVRL